MRDLPNLDFLRAVAVLSVVIEHTLLAYGIRRIGSWDVAWIGVIGVFIFFVHTSLVLMWSLERKPDTFGFYIRRAFRIYPLVWATILAVLLFHAPVSGTVQNYFQYQSFSQKPIALLKACFLVPNLGQSPQLLPESVMWSLPYEMEMYVGLPVLFFFVRRNFSYWPLLVFWGLLVALNQSAFTHESHNFYLCIPYFLPGILAYVGFGRQKAVLPSWLFPIFLAGMWTWFMRDPYWRRADLLCLGLGLALPFFCQITSKPVVAASHTVAKYSFGMYLSHPFAIVLGIYLLPHAHRAVQISVITTGTVLLSVGAYHLIEHPMIRLGSRLASRAERALTQREQEPPRMPGADVVWDGNFSGKYQQL